MVQFLNVDYVDENSVDPDQLASLEATDLELACFLLNV